MFSRICIRQTDVKNRDLHIFLLSVTDRTAPFKAISLVVFNTEFSTYGISRNKKKKQKTPTELSNERFENVLRSGALCQ